MSVIDDVKSRLDIVEVVSGYVPELKKAGRTWKARCPFHSERTPSFAVDPERQTWHCFGSCSTGGDVIEFVRKVENLDFREALQRLAERAGVELRAPSPREREEREQHERLLAANEAAAVFWQAALAGAEGGEARAYAERRGLDDATVRAWQLGFAPDGWRSLTDHLVARGFSEDDLIEAGLAIKGDRGVYDRFRYRLIFPTRDGRRRLIGFGARAMRPGDEPKYLNTPQTPLFDKSGNLYGLDRAGDA
ncbi:MAG: DNA primase, partial [Dehalococcoidia bacterium]